jgi:hypothetical protein
MLAYRESIPAVFNVGSVAVVLHWPFGLSVTPVQSFAGPPLQYMSPQLPVSPGTTLVV